jgi:ribosomal small subunit protein bTHX
MGKGDRRTKKGKRFRSTYGNKRPKKGKPTTKPVTPSRGR